MTQTKRILNSLITNYRGGIALHFDTSIQAAEQTALEFTKWKDDNYVYQKSIGKYAEKVEGKWSFFTSEQLFNEWNNLNK